MSVEAIFVQCRSQAAHYWKALLILHSDKQMLHLVKIIYQRKTLLSIIYNVKILELQNRTEKQIFSAICLLSNDNSFLQWGPGVAGPWTFSNPQLFKPCPYISHFASYQAEMILGPIIRQWILKPFYGFNLIPGPDHIMEIWSLLWSQ